MRDLKVKVAVQNLEALQAQHKRCHQFHVILRLSKIIRVLKKEYDEKITEHRYQSNLNKKVVKMQGCFKRYLKRQFTGLEVKKEN